MSEDKLIARLRSQAKLWRIMGAASDDDINMLLDASNRLSELDALRKDAERYRYLRSEPILSVYLNMQEDGHDGLLQDETLDAYCDAAMTKERQS